MKTVWKILKIFVFVLLVLLLFFAVQLFIGSHHRAEDQTMMVKSDEDLIGKHFFVPREEKPDVDVNLYILGDDERHPVVFNIHGGAFIAGDADTLDTQSDRISRAWGVQVVCVNYSLALNGTGIEEGTQEIVDTVLYFREHAAEYHIDPEQLYIMGYSAGGYHTMASVLSLRKLSVDVAGQILCYAYLRDTLDIYMAMTPEQQASIAPALFLIAEGDPIGEGSLQYEEALRNSGVATQVITCKGALHGFIEENNPEYEPLHRKASKSPEQEALARKAEAMIGQWIEERSSDS